MIQLRDENQAAGTSSGEPGGAALRLQQQQAADAAAAQPSEPDEWPPPEQQGGAEGWEAAAESARGEAGEADDGGPAGSRAGPRAVPWGLNVTATVMAVWLLGFWAAAYLGVPFILELLGLDPAGGGSRVQAFKHLLLDVAQLLITLGLLRRSLAGYHPRSRYQLFAVRWRPVRAWALPLAAGVATFPLIDWVHRQMVALLAAGEAAAGQALQGGGAAQGTMEQILAAQDWAAHGMWFAVLAVCAPVWEEVMFRGFLLPSLAKYLPQWAAVAATAALFGLVHFTREGFLPLLLLGCVFGLVYVRTRNLVAPVLLHSAWNVMLLVQILLMGGPS